MYINEYVKDGLVVDCTVGLRDKRQAARHGHKVCFDKGYDGFTVLHKRNKPGTSPAKVAWHDNRLGVACKICCGPDRDGPPYDAATATGMYDGW